MQEAPTQTSQRYLTVQDMLWLNLQVSKKVEPFDYARMEEATYYQYGYGDSRGLVLQAGRFLAGFLKLKPLAAGNEATGFLGFVSFLLLNGKKLRLSDGEASAWAGRVASGDLKVEVALPDMLEDEHDFHPGQNEIVEECMAEVLRRYPSMV